MDATTLISREIEEIQRYGHRKDLELTISDASELGAAKQVLGWLLDIAEGRSDVSVAHKVCTWKWEYLQKEFDSK